MTCFDFFDLPLQRFLTQFANQSDLFDRTVFAISEYDTFKGVILFSLLWFAWFLKAPVEQQKENRQTLLIVFVGTVLAVVMARLMQIGLNVHPRPVHMDLGMAFPSVVDPQKLNTWNSFPSDHAIYFFALATGLWRVHKGLSLFAFAWTTLMVFLPRLYLGIHHPSDILAGSLIGILFMVGFLRIGWIKRLAAQTLSWSESQPSLFYGLAFLATINAAHLFDDLREIGGGMIHGLKGLV